MAEPTAADEFVSDSSEKFTDDLCDLIAQPSVSATGEGIQECANLVKSLCESYGFDEARLVESAGHPAVLAKAFVDHNEKNEYPTVLMYGHYDVQPVNREEWSTPPFEPTIREDEDGNERIYARGAGDNKAQWFAHLCAVKALRETSGLPINVALLVEGEEESGSKNLESVVSEIADEVDATLVYGADGPIDDSGRPVVQMGSRGLLYVQIDVTSANRDLHSGHYGNIVPNPAWELLNILETMKDDSGRITIDGYHDDIREMTDLDKETLDNIPFDVEGLKEDLGIKELDIGPGEGLEKTFYYPTLNIAGFTSGYGGEGTKTVLPCKAQAKIDMRLVADQDPDDIYEKFVDHVNENSSNRVDVEVSYLGSMDTQRTPLDSPFREPVIKAVKDSWGAEPILKPSTGGSFPFYVFENEFNLPCIKVPYANSDEKNHSPYENLKTDCFFNGIGTSIRLLENLK